MPRILVLGGSGFIGQPLIRSLIKANHEVVNLDIRDSHSVDLREAKIPELSSFDCCAFLAWDVGGSKYLGETSKWREQYRNNIALMNNLFPQLANSDIRVLFVSSQLAGKDQTPYSLTKLVGEKYSLTLENSVVARQWNAYGDMENQDMRSHVISDFVFQAVNYGEIKMLSNGLEQRKFVHMDDICTAYIKLLLGMENGIFDVSGDSYLSIIEIATYIADETGAKVIPGRTEGLTPVVPDYPKVSNWSPTVDIKEGIRRLIRVAIQRRDK